MNNCTLVASGLDCFPNAVNVTSTCVHIQTAISNASAVWFPGSELYDKDILHWASSSTQPSVCSVEPGSSKDVSTILRILGQTKTPFAVKGGGHIENPGFSSTPGVQLAMFRFSQVTFDQHTMTVDIGSGLVWDDVYRALDPLGVNVVGARATGIGVAGFLLGGGYSYLTSQHGLAIDNIVAYELVLPDGTVAEVTATSSPDLFFALKGGYNNFGIVTRFTLTAFPQGKVWGGALQFSESQIPAITSATAAFASNVKDPKAAIITTYLFFLGEPGVSMLIFYDAPEPPSGMFDDFLLLPATTSDISSRSFLSLYEAPQSNATAGLRGFQHTVSILNVSESLLKVVANETAFWGQATAGAGGFVTHDVEPFVAPYFEKSKGGAYPHSPDLPLLPLALAWQWTDPTADAFIASAMKQSVATILKAAVAEGQKVDGSLQIKYPNYALADTPLVNLYGKNVARLQSLKQRYDPRNVMSLAGGFKF